MLSGRDKIWMLRSFWGYKSQKRRNFRLFFGKLKKSLDKCFQMFCTFLVQVGKQSTCSCSYRGENVYSFDTFFVGLHWSFLHLWLWVWVSCWPFECGVCAGETRLQSRCLAHGPPQWRIPPIHPRALLPQQVLLLGYCWWGPQHLTIRLGFLQVRVQFDHGKVKKSSLIKAAMYIIWTFNHKKGNAEFCCWWRQ